MVWFLKVKGSTEYGDWLPIRAMNVQETPLIFMENWWFEVTYIGHCKDQFIGQTFWRKNTGCMFESIRYFPFIKVSKTGFCLFL